LVIESRRQRFREFPAHKHAVEFEFIYDGLGMGTFAYNNLSGVGRPGEGIMRVNGKEVARKKMEKTIPITLAWDESQDIALGLGVRRQLK
jgi:arylsulfatase